MCKIASMEDKDWSILSKDNLVIKFEQAKNIIVVYQK